MADLTALDHLRRRSSALTGGRADVTVSGDEHGWYVGVAVKPRGERNRILRAESVRLVDAIRSAVRRVP